MSVHVVLLQVLLNPDVATCMSISMHYYKTFIRSRDSVRCNNSRRELITVLSCFRAELVSAP